MGVTAEKAKGAAYEPEGMLPKEDKPERRYISQAKAKKALGLGYKEVLHLCETGQLPTLTTSTGKVLVDVQTPMQNAKLDLLEAKIKELSKKLDAIMRQFNTAYKA
ncbi:MAG: hypothetical protein LBT59_01995 [Clostridiales bacterium]|jgi:hypothetical protein|nr:hypothetical protein [Clostridiales bacterium]